MDKKTLIILLFFLVFGQLLKAQDSVIHRMILIGDAGEIDKQQMAVLGFAANKVIKNKTTVIYLGDNVYPRGMSLPGSPDQGSTENILRSEYEPMRAKGAPVYFLAGNHDWDRMGPLGLEKIKRQWQYLEEQKDSLLRLVPGNGCPDPYEIRINDKLVVIAFDSEWWVFPHNKVNPGADCSCQTKTDVTNRLAELYYRNRDKIILLASHHPFQSYGIHGGVFSFKDHLFPFTAINKDLYIPLPGVGSLYPLMRTVFANPEDMGHPEYRDMIKKVDGVFGGYPNLVHIAGHDHGLQFIKNDKEQYQVVSGAGAKDVYVKQGKFSLFADAIQGFVTADLMKDNSMRFTYYIYTQQGVKPAFTYTKPYVPVAALNEQRYKDPGADSITVSIHPAYDSVSGFHRAIFGENYRKEWAAKVKLPYLKLSKLHGGLAPEQRGGGMQTKSLRLIDRDGKEWVLRTVEKDPAKLLPEDLQGTIAYALLDDATSAQHPFGALVVSPIAEALHIPHAHPVVGVVAPDPNLGEYANVFINRVCLLEEREPTGKSDNTEKAEQALKDDNNNHINGKEFIRARMLDVLIGDWDRHEDQWRWQGEKIDGGKLYTSVPRDRDQALYTRQGLVENLAARRWILPTLQGFNSRITDVEYSLFKTRFMSAYPDLIVSHAEWMKIADGIKSTVTDSVLEVALDRLPPEIYRIQHDELFKTFKDRRDNLPAAMDEYYRFANRIVDIRLSDKNEQVDITDASNNGMGITVHQLSKKGKLQDTLLKAVFDPSITQEVRLFVADGNDKVTIDTKTTAIKLRIVGGDGDKQYEVTASNKKIKLYGRADNNHSFTSDSTRFITHFSNDTANTAIHNTNLYNITMPLASVALNRDDGFLLGLGFKYTGQGGFRKFPYTTTQELLVTHSFTTNAFRVNYKGDWTKVIGKADLLLEANIKAPNNTMNFFGRGNGSVYDQSKDFAVYYRTRFNTYDFSPSLRWHTPGGSSFSVGPSIYYYHFAPDENAGRFINDVHAIGSYDSTSVNKDKLHGGLVMDFLSDKRNNKIFPTSGLYFNVKAVAYTGLNGNSKSFAQVIPELALYTSLSSRLVLAERLGGGVTIGQTAFYQSLFLGGQGNLLGFRQNRFSGQHMIYNNLEARLKLGDISSYVLPGQFGLSGFYDAGRVWDKHDQSNTIHQGVGGGFYFAPAGVFVLQVQAGYSTEGWYPEFSFQYRF
jgi:Calcineurin-like phosphoesterase